MFTSTAAAINASAVIMWRGVAGRATATPRMALPTISPSLAPGVNQASESAGLTALNLAHELQQLREERGGNDAVFRLLDAANARLDGLLGPAA